MLQARCLLHQFRTLPTIPCTLDGLCLLCAPGMWDSGHVPAVRCVGGHEDGVCPSNTDSPSWGWSLALSIKVRAELYTVNQRIKCCLSRASISCRLLWHTSSQITGIVWWRNTKYIASTATAICMILQHSSVCSHLVTAFHEVQFKSCLSMFIGSLFARLTNRSRCLTDAFVLCLVK